MKSTVKKYLICVLICLLMVCVVFPAFAVEETEDNNSLGNANLIELNDFVVGRLSEKGKDDWYRFEVSEVGVLNFRFSAPNETSSSKAWQIVLQDNYSHTLYTMTAKGGSGEQSSISVGLSAGVYYARVTAQSAKYSNAEYTLFVDFTESNCWEKEWNGESKYATEITAGTEYRGLMATAKEEDWYSFSYDGVSDMTIIFERAPQADENANWNLGLWRSNAELKPSYSNVSELRISLKERNLTEGTYYIKITTGLTSRYNSEYRLSIETAHACDLILVERQEPTCSENGNIEHSKCSQCGKLYVEGQEVTDVSIPSRGHDVDGAWVIDAEATCTETGSKSHHCTRNGCDYKENATEIPATGHQIQNSTIIERIDPTCTENGSTKTYCTVSGCNGYEIEELDALGHSMGSDLVIDAPATCVEAGSKSHHCTRNGCDYKENVTEIPATGHQIQNSTVIERIEPTCTESGSTKTYCTVNGCDGYEVEELDALGHSMGSDWVIDAPATCVEAGRKSHHCMRDDCDYRENVTGISPLGHNMESFVSKPATCVQSGVILNICSVCGYQEDEAVPPTMEHSFGEWQVKKEATCAEEGEKTQICSGCGLINEDAIAKLPHTQLSDWETAVLPNCTETGSEYRTCAACGGQADVRELDALGHAFSDSYTVDEMPSCETVGSQSKHCSRCDAREDVTEIPALGHSFDEWSEVAAPTCTEKGVESRVCARCGTRGIRDGSSPLGHDFGDTFVIDREATCEEAGLKFKNCSRCQIRSEDTEIPAKGHSFSGWSVFVSATCTEKGKESRSCSVCQKTEIKDTLSALGHTYPEEYVVDLEATCEVVGSKSKHCIRCDSQSQIVEIPATGHAFGEWYVTASPTCVKKGKECRQCVLCDKTEIKDTDSPLGHSFGQDFLIDMEATCEVAGSKSKHCVRCSAVDEVTEISPLGHSYGTWNVTSEPTCEETGKKQRVCVVCDKIDSVDVLQALGHLFEQEFTVDTEATCDTEGSKSKHCVRCDKLGEVTIIPAKGHSFDVWSQSIAPTCTEKGRQTRVCEVCGWTESRETENALGHDFDTHYTVDIEASCETVGSRSKHCSRCDATDGVTEIPAKGHDIGDWFVSAVPTCEKAGLEIRSCGHCGKKESRSAGDALGHDFGKKFTVDVVASCYAEGSESKHCSRCDARAEQRSIPMLKHVYGDGVVSVAPTSDSVGKKVFTCVNCNGAYEQEIEKLPPVMLDVSETVIWKPSSEESLHFRSAAALEDFVEVRVNGQVVPRDCYELREGSTIVELKPEYLKTLEKGSYTLEIVSTTGVAEAEFTVSQSNAIVWILCGIGALVLLIGIVCMFPSKKTNETFERTPAPKIKPKKDNDIL